MSKIYTGGPAFPHECNAQYHERSGMTLRDYFAAKALSAIYATAMAEAREGSGLFQHDDWRTGLVLDAYAMADAMLRAREQTP